MAISGAVGTYSNIDPAIEVFVADKLGLTAADVFNTQGTAAVDDAMRRRKARAGR